MSKFRFTNKAVFDLSQIWNHTIDKWSEIQADKYYKMLIDSCNEIAYNPQIGKNYSGVTENIFGFKTGRHVIFYRILKSDEVEIIRILHEQMDIKLRVIEK